MGCFCTESVLVALLLASCCAVLPQYVLSGRQLVQQLEAAVNEALSASICTANIRARCQQEAKDCANNRCIFKSCTTSKECANEAPYCVDDRCMQRCRKDADCDGIPNRRYCVAGACRKHMCSTDRHCSKRTEPGLGPYCVTGNGVSVCRECRDSTGCSNNPNRRFCNVQQGSCVQCITDGECTMARPRLHDSTAPAALNPDSAAMLGFSTAGGAAAIKCAAFRCVEVEVPISNGTCISDAACEAGQVPFGPVPFCNPTTSTCAECSDSRPCPAGLNGASSSCVNGTCQQCLTDADCPKQFLQPGGFCNTATSKCVECRGKDSHCFGKILPGTVLAPVCIDDGSCKVCRNDTHCEGRAGLEVGVGPYCVKNMCVDAGKACTADADCKYFLNSEDGYAACMENQSGPCRAVCSTESKRCELQWG